MKKVVVALLLTATLICGCSTNSVKEGKLVDNSTETIANKISQKKEEAKKESSETKEYENGYIAQYSDCSVGYCEFPVNVLLKSDNGYNILTESCSPLVSKGSTQSEGCVNYVASFLCTPYEDTLSEEDKTNLVNVKSTDAKFFLVDYYTGKMIETPLNEFATTVVNVKGVDYEILAKIEKADSACYYRFCVTYPENYDGLVIGSVSERLDVNDEDADDLIFKDGILDIDGKANDNGYARDDFKLMRFKGYQY